MSVYQEILSELQARAVFATSIEPLQRFLVDAIPQRLPHYNWTGFYMLDPEDKDTLVLGPFHGAPTDHVRIPVSRGICGAAVAQNQTVIVDDVHSDPRYLACSIETKSEIVVPIRVRDAVVGEIDIDSHTAAAFTAEDRAFLESCAEVFGDFLAR